MPNVNRKKLANRKKQVGIWFKQKKTRTRMNSEWIGKTI